MARLARTLARHVLPAMAVPGDPVLAGQSGHPRRRGRVRCGKKWKFEVGVFFQGVGPDAPDDKLLAIARTTGSSGPTMAGDPGAALCWLWTMVAYSRCTDPPPHRVSDECDDHEHLCSWMWQPSLSPGAEKLAPRRAIAAPWSCAAGPGLARRRCSTTRRAPARGRWAARSGG